MLVETAVQWGRVGEDVCLEGWGAYEAAVVCSSVAAGQYHHAAPCCAAPTLPPTFVTSTVANRAAHDSSSDVQQDGWERKVGVVRLL